MVGYTREVYTEKKKSPKFRKYFLIPFLCFDFKLNLDLQICNYNILSHTGLLFKSK